MLDDSTVHSNTTQHNTLKLVQTSCGGCFPLAASFLLAEVQPPGAEVGDVQFVSAAAAHAPHELESVSWAQQAHHQVLAATKLHLSLLPRVGGGGGGQQPMTGVQSAGHHCALSHQLHPQSSLPSHTTATFNHGQNIIWTE